MTTSTFSLFTPQNEKSSKAVHKKYNEIEIKKGFKQVFGGV